MTKQVPTYLPKRINRYCPACTYAVDAEDGKVTTVNFGTPAAAAAAAILSAQSISPAGSTTTLLSSVSDATFGRNLTYVASGAATSTVTARGRDFWGQPVAETITLNGATPVVGLKCFYTLDSFSWTNTNATTINVGWGTSLGLPYKAEKVIAENLNDAPGTIGTLTAPVLTDPQTAITGEPRGSYVTNAAMNGTNVIDIVLLCSPRVNAAGNGGLHGIAHFFA